MRVAPRAATHNRILEEPAMAKARTLVGLDVHAAKIVVAVLDADTGELQWFAMNGENARAAAFCAGLPRPVRVAYEAGPTGYVLARELAKRGVECVIAAPSKIPRATGDKVKNDRRDAEHLVRLLLAGKLHPVRVPGPEEEALRDLVRARETLKSNNEQPPSHIPRSAGSVAARDARGTRDLPMSNPGDRATLDPIDSGTPRRTMVMRPPGSANIRLTRVAHSNPDRHPPSRPLHTPDTPNAKCEKSPHPA